MVDVGRAQRRRERLHRFLCQAPVFSLLVGGVVGIVWGWSWAFALVASSAVASSLGTLTLQWRHISTEVYPRWERAFDASGSLVLALAGAVALLTESPYAVGALLAFAVVYAVGQLISVHRSTRRFKAQVVEWERMYSELRQQEQP